MYARRVQGPRNMSRLNDPFTTHQALSTSQSKSFVLQICMCLIHESIKTHSNTHSKRIRSILRNSVRLHFSLAPFVEAIVLVNTLPHTICSFLRKKEIFYQQNTPTTNMHQCDITAEYVTAGLGWCTKRCGGHPHRPSHQEI